MIDVTKNDPNGCHATALPDEPVFTLLARDKQAAGLVRKWADDRERNGDMPPHFVGDPPPQHPQAEKIAAARYVAARMEVWRYEHHRKDNGDD